MRVAAATESAPVVSVVCLALPPIPAKAPKPTLASGPAIGIAALIPYAQLEPVPV
jgi:hypothetical protein